MTGLPIACVALFTLALLPSNLFAQCEGQTAQCEGQKATQGTAIQIPVTGLTGKNADQLTALMQKVGVDPSQCDTSEDGGPFAMGEGSKDASCGDACPMMVVSSAKADVEKGLLLLTVAPKKSVRLSQIAMALEDSSFAVDEKKLRLVGSVTLSVEGLTCGGCAGRATKAVQTVKGTKEIDVVLGSKEESFMNLTLDEGGVKYADVLAAMETTSYFIGDVSWKAAEVPASDCCSEKEKTPGCCPETDG
ncbi:MAG: heavy-metal-associated domain-containing protein [Planctomycetota bacterium]